MAAIYERFTKIVSNWPIIHEIKVLDYGYHLRNLVKNRDHLGNVFPGTVAENSAKLDSLMRLVNNTYGLKYPCMKKKGACGLELKSLESKLTADIKMHLSKLKST